MCWFSIQSAKPRASAESGLQSRRIGVGVEPVGEPGRVLPRPPYHEQQEQGLQRSPDGRVVQEQVRELSYREDVDKVEEQFQRCNPLLACAAGSQQTYLIGPLHLSTP